MSSGALLWLGGLLLLCARGAWEWTDPMGPADFKGLFYIRDFATLAPAALCWYAAIVRSGLRLPRVLAGPFVVDWFRRQSARPWRMTAILATLISFACAAISVFVLQTRAHIVDEAGYLFQAKIFAEGQLWAQSPAELADFFALQYVVITPDKWYGSFFPGQSLVLVPGVLLGMPFLINPLLTGLLLTLTVWAGRRLFDSTTGLLAGALMLGSPFILFQGASYFSHIITAILFLVAATWLFTSDRTNLWENIGIGLCGGAMLLCRPLSAMVLALWAVGWWSWRLMTKQRSLRAVVRQATLAAIGAAPGLGLLLLYNDLLTGHPLVTPHEVALPDDALGLGLHTITNTTINLVALTVDLLGVPLLSWLPLAAYALVGEKKWLKPLGALVGLYIIAYGLYRYHGLSYGPRLYFEITPLLLLASSRGLLVLSSLPSSRSSGLLSRWAPYAGGLCLVVNGVVMICGVLPPRVRVFHERARYYDVRAVVEAPAPAIILVTGLDDERLTPYMAGFQLNTIGLAGPHIFARDLQARNRELLAAYPERRVYRLDPETREMAPYVADPPAP